ncbi:cytochrome b/b6 domain-containing protein [Bacteroidota bacterium]
MENNNGPKWDKITRITHFLTIITLLFIICTGLLMIFKKELGLSSVEAKTILKKIHVIIAYLFTLNLILRIIWGFMGSYSARWKNIIPGKGFGTSLKEYKESVKKNQPIKYNGHTPETKVFTTLVYFVLIIIVLTGLVRAGTDIYFPPFGKTAANYIVKEGENPKEIKPYDKQFVDEVKYEKMDRFKKPFGKVHLYSFYLVFLMSYFHIRSSIKAKKRGEGLISSIFLGY